MDVKQVIAIVGPESTGKTTLANGLSNHFYGDVVPEFSRQYLDSKNESYQKDDLFTIAQKQLELEKEHFAESNGPFFCDTDILVIMIWHQFKYGSVDTRIEELFHQQVPRTYLLTYPDLIWEPDPLRENPNDLMQLFNEYETALKKIGAEYYVVKGSGDKRLKAALNIISQMKLA